MSRKKVSVFLDMDNELDQEIYQLIWELKASGKWSKSFKQAVRIICGLLSHDLTALDEEFPFVRDKILAECGGGNPELMEKVDRVERAILARATKEEYEHAPHLIPVGNIAGPVFDDDEIMLEVVADLSGNEDIGTNFLKSLEKLQ